MPVLMGLWISGHLNFKDMVIIGVFLHFLMYHLRTITVIKGHQLF